jgi:hypothetical protein
LIQGAASILLQAPHLIKVALEGPIGHPASIRLYPPSRLRPVESS